MLKKVPHRDPDTEKFVDDELELYVWRSDNEIIGFQLWYDKPGTERAIIWTQTDGFEHAALEPGNPSTMVIPGGEPDLAHASREFTARCALIDPGIQDFVAVRILEVPTTIRDPGSTD